MGENTKIEWATHSWNPWVGCTKVSPACDHCYAEGWAKRTGQAGLWNGERRRTSAANWRQPIKWSTAAAIAGERHRVFCASLADVFDNQADPEWRADLWRLIEVTPSLDWLLLTKRPQNIEKMLPRNWGDGWPNVWLGTTVENQLEAERRIPHLRDVPAAIRFLSCEPLLGPLDLDCLLWQPCPNFADTVMDPTTGIYECCSRCDYTGIGDELAIHWVIAGGESGSGARPMHPSWPISLRDSCAAAGVPFFFKQWGEFSVDEIGPEDARSLHHPPGHVIYNRVGKARAGRKLHGELHNAFPSTEAANV